MKDATGYPFEKLPTITFVELDNHAKLFGTWKDSTVVPRVGDHVLFGPSRRRIVCRVVDVTFTDPAHIVMDCERAKGRRP